MEKKCMQFTVSDVPWWNNTDLDNIYLTQEEAEAKAKEVKTEKGYAMVWARTGNCVLASRWMPWQAFGEHISERLGRDYREADKR